MSSEEIFEKVKGIIIEQKLTVGIQNNALPIAESNIEIQVPKIENKTANWRLTKKGPHQRTYSQHYNFFQLKKEFY